MTSPGKPEKPDAKDSASPQADRASPWRGILYGLGSYVVAVSLFIVYLSIDISAREPGAHWLMALLGKPGVKWLVAGIFVALGTRWLLQGVITFLEPREPHSGDPKKGP